MEPLISHPPEGDGIPLLQDHLEKVGQLAAELIRPLPLNLSVPKKELMKAAFLIGVCHDFGKAKHPFQNYVRGKGPRWNTEHALLSSLLTFLVAKDVFEAASQPARLLAFVCPYVVNRHHGVLVRIEDAFDLDRLDYEHRQAQGVLDERIWEMQFRWEDLHLNVDFAKYRGEFEHMNIRDIASRFTKLSNYLREITARPEALDSWPLDLYWSVLLLISVLAEADRAAVVGAKLPGPARPLPPDRVRHFATSRPAAAPVLQSIRESAWQEIATAPTLKGIHRLTLPTGAGKTLMGLYLAARSQQDGPIIYALPYLSIIEQTAQVAKEALRSTEISVVQHHSLSFPDPQGIKAGEEAANFEQVCFALESWDADLIVTTFDQLIYSFLSPDRAFLRRFFRLPGAFLVLDEVQALPARLIPAVENLLLRASEKLGVNILYMTATSPPFLMRARPFLRNEARTFQQLQRVELELHITKPTPLNRFIEDLEGWLATLKGKAILIVANTIRSSLDIYDALIKLHESIFPDLRPVYLSGNVVPVHRLQRIRQVKDLLNRPSRPWVVVVSTQCVEAGVDIDMDLVVRDFGPWDSIMQVCGRANRYAIKERAIVKVQRWLDTLENRSVEFHRYIYDPVMTDATLEVLQPYHHLREEKFLQVQQEYARLLEERLSTQVSEDLVTKALSWQFDELETRKILRGPQGWRVPVFCIADETAQAILEVARLAWADGDSFAALRRLHELCSREGLILKPLQDFLRIDLDPLKRWLEELMQQSQRTQKFRLPHILAPFLRAYTIDLPIRSLDALQGSLGYLINRGFAYTERYDEKRGFFPKAEPRLWSNII